MVAVRVLALLPLVLLPAAAQAQTPLADPSGTYLTEDGRARIRVEFCGPQKREVCGYVVWLKEQGAQPDKLDSKNPDPARTSRPLLGHQLIMGLKRRPENYEGTIYNSENGKQYNVTIWKDGSDLKVRGCLVAFLCATQTWTPAAGRVPGELAGLTGRPDGPRPDPEWASAETTAPATPARREARPKS